MAIEKNSVEPYEVILRRLHENATYSAQAYFEASKAAEFWGKAIVFVPAIVAAISGALVALDFSKAWGVASAAAGLVSATGSFLGAERKAPIFKESARRYTQLRHTISSILTLSMQFESIQDLAVAVEGIERRYLEIVGEDEPVPNRYYKRASRRIKSGIV